MASVVVTLKIMPESPETNLDAIFEQAKEQVISFIDEKHRNGEIRKDIEPVAFGLKALKIIFVMDENIGSTDGLEDNVRKITGVTSADTIDVRRAIG